MDKSKPMRSPLAAWLRRAPLGSAQTFNELYQRTHVVVFRYVFGLSGGRRAEAEDLAAETFLRAWKARHTFTGDSDGAALGWLLKIARRLAIDAHRRGVARPEEAAPLEDYPALAALPEEGFAAEQERQTLLRLLQTLPEESRELLTLRYLLGWRVTEISAYNGKSENTISQAIRRALEKLQAAWPEEEI